MKSTDVAIQMMKKVIDGNECNPHKIVARVNIASQVVPIKLNSKGLREHLTSNILENTIGPNLSRNISQSSKERSAFTRYLERLFKTKKAICESMNLEESQMIINNNYKKIYFVNDHEIQFIVKLSATKIMQ